MLAGGQGSPKTVTNHGRDFLWTKNFVFSQNRYCDGRFVILVCDSERLNDFGVSIWPFGIVLESKDKSQEAGKVSRPRDMLRRGIFEAK